MAFTSVQLEALRLLLGARLASIPANDGSRPKWEGTLAATEAELARCKPGPRVFALDLPLSVTLPPAPPAAPKPAKVRKRPLTEKQLAKASVAQRKREAKAAKRGPPKPIVLVPAPTLNSYAAMKTFVKIRIRKYLDELIESEKARWPDWHWGGNVVEDRADHKMPVGGRRRLVRVTRFSSRRPDEDALDILGAKIPLDRLVEAKVLGGDSDVWIVRDGRWEAVKPAEGHVLVEVFELTGDAAVPRVNGRAKRAKSVRQGMVDVACSGAHGS